MRFNLIVKSLVVILHQGLSYYLHFTVFFKTMQPTVLTHVTNAL